MSDIQFSEQLQKADQWSKALALFVAMGVFSVGLVTTENTQMNTVAAAVAGIGTRFVIPYKVSLSIPAEERVSISDHPAAGNYNHGAAGGALLVGSLVMVVLMAVRPDSVVALLAGGGSIVVTYIVLKSVLPDI